MTIVPQNAVAVIRSNKKRLIIWAIALIPLVFFLIVVREFPILNNTIFKELIRKQTGAIDFYSGTEGGVYYDIGQKLMEQNTKSDSVPILGINNKITRGSLANLAFVSRLPNSFGIVQADSLKQNDIEFGGSSKENIQLVTPLYLELMHLIMRQKDYDDFMAKMDGDRKEANQHFLKKILANRIISTGPFQGGTNSYAAAILNAEEVNTRQNSYNISLKEGVGLLRENKIDAYFFMGGIPVPELNKTFTQNSEDVALTLVPVTGKFPLVLQRDLKLQCIRSNIPRGTYPLVDEDISTVGIPAWLIASKDIDTKTILNVLKKMHELPLADSEFKENIDNAIYKFESTKKAEFEGRASRMALLLITFIGAYVVVLSVVIAICSKMTQALRFESIHKIYLEHIGKHFDIEDNDYGRPLYPMAFPEANDNLKLLINGVSELNKHVRKIRIDYNEGTLMIMDMRFLLDRLYGVLEIFHRQVTQHIYFMIISGEDPSEISDLGELIKQYYCTGYILLDDYK